MTIIKSREVEIMDRLYKQGDLLSLANMNHGIRYLLIRSLGRKEWFLAAAESLKVDVRGVKASGLFRHLFDANIEERRWQDAIREVYEAIRSARRKEEPVLLAELFKLRVFDWGGIHQNDINKHIVGNYVKRIKSYDELVSRIENELLDSLKGFTLCSWYNNWTSILIEDIFTDHPRVIPAIGKVKMIDFFIEDMPFDLKVTYFPVGFMEEQRQAKGLPKKELTALKQLCRIHHVPFDSQRHTSDLHQDLVSALSESSDPDVREAYREFVACRQEIIDEAMDDPHTLRRWLYENQGTIRFDTSNRVFVILIDKENLEQSWKLKRDYPLLVKHIRQFLDQRPFSPDSLRTEWAHEGKQFVSFSDMLFVVK